MPVVRIGGARGRGGGLRLSAETEQGLLRVALEAALLVARAGEAASPPDPAPASLRPFLGFAKYPSRALDAARKVLDDDPDFRSRVRAAMRPDVVTDAVALFLDRPDGWEDALAELVAAREAERSSQSEAQAERRATKQLAVTQGTLSKVVEEFDAMRSAMAAEQARVRELEAAVTAGEAEAERLREERANAVRQLKAIEARDAGRVEELRQLRERLRAAEAAPVSDAVPEPAEPAEPAVDLAAVAAAVHGAADAAAALAAALADLRALVASAVVAPVEPAEAAPARTVPARRRPTKLPVGIFDDAPQAVGALLRVEGMLTLVDGYNVTLAGWPALDLELQRARLLDVLTGLDAATPARFTVVFDGAPTGAGLPPESRLRSVQVRFTDPAVEADDDILALVEQLPVARPVLVVSDDHRVRDGARARGANVVGSRQFLDYVRGM